MKIIKNKTCRMCNSTKFREVINIGKYKMIGNVKNPTLKYTTTAFREKFGPPIVSDNFQIGPDGAYEHEN